MTTTVTRWRWAVPGVVAAALALAAPGIVANEADAQQSPARGKAGGGGAGNANPRGGAGRRGGANANNNPAPDRRKGAAAPKGDPLAKQADADPQAKAAAPGTYHFRLKVQTFDNTALNVSYYPATKQDTTAAVVVLVHEKDRSDKDFEDPISELKNKGLAESLQAAGYAVLSFDLRGQGSNPRKVATEQDWKLMVDDLQSIYQFLVDRHNRGELNVAKLGVVALGEGANLAAAWAYQPGGAVSSEGRVSDLSGLVLISPQATGVSYNLSTLMTTLAPRFPILLMVGERDNASHDAVKKVRATVERTRQNKVEVFPSSLRGYKLLRLEPRATTVLTRFLETTVSKRAVDWEPRYNLTPVTYSDIQVVRHAKPDARAKDAEKADAEKKDAAGKARDEKPAPAEAKEKAKDEDKSEQP